LQFLIFKKCNFLSSKPWIWIRIRIRLESNVDPQRCMQAFLMVVIMLTGNYNFFNFLYMALCLSLADNSWLGMVRFYHLLRILTNGSRSGSGYCYFRQ